MTFTSILFVALLLFLSISSSSTTIKKLGTLTPSDYDGNGVQVSMAAHDIIPTPNVWSINVSSNNGWHFHISMNTSWKFPHDCKSIITLKTYSNSSTNSPNKDIIFAFGQNTNKYISSIIEINGSNNGIYPELNPTNNEENVLMAAGDIDSLLTDNNETKTRKYKLTSGSNNYQLIPSNSKNEFPLVIQLINDPMNKWSKWKYSNQQCQFEPFSTDYPIDIYISAAEIGQILNIQRFEIELSYNKTEISNQFDVSETDANSDTNANNNIGSFSQILEENRKTIIFFLVGITICLFFVCIVLLVIVIKEIVQPKNDGIEPEFDDNKSQNIQNVQMARIMAMEGKTSMVLDVETEESNFEANDDVVNIENNNDEYYDDDDAVVFGMVWTADNK